MLKYIAKKQIANKIIVNVDLFSIRDPEKVENSRYFGIFDAKAVFWDNTKQLWASGDVKSEKILK